jgi:hypothetical protein
MVNNARFPSYLWVGGLGLLLLCGLGCSSQKETPSIDNGTVSERNGTGVDAGKEGRGKKGGRGQPGTDSGENVCASQDIEFFRSKPVIMFVVDRSASMAVRSGDASVNRWQAAYSALMDPNEGVIALLHSDHGALDLYLGMTLFDGEGTGEEVCPYDPYALCPEDAGTRDPSDTRSRDKEDASCARFVTVDPATDNFAAIAGQYADQKNGPRKTTPTALALREAYRIVQNLAIKAALTENQKSIVLVTDGESNSCDATAPDFQGPADAVENAAQNGIRTYVLAVDATDARVASELDKLARLGETGVDRAFTLSNTRDLAKALAPVFSASPDCDIALKGTVPPGMDNRGKVWLNGEPLEYNGVNGYLVKYSDKTPWVVLQGKACEKLRHGERQIEVHVEFPCSER